MRELKMDAPETMPQLTILNYGDTRSGKTTFGGSFPRPLILADTTERGWKSAFTMAKESRFEPDVEPIVWGIEQMNDLASIYPKLDPLIESGRVCSVIFDAFSFYCDFYLASIIRLQGKPDNRAAYGALGLHLREVRVQLHQKRVNIVWNCLAKHPDEADSKGRPLIPGQQGDKFAAGVDYLFYSRLQRTGKDESFEIRTRQYGSYIAGHREGINADRLPDPFCGTYSDFVTALGYDTDAIRGALKKIQAAPATKPAAVAVKPASPAVTINKAPQAPRGSVVNNQQK